MAVAVSSMSSGLREAAGVGRRKRWIVASALALVAASLTALLLPAPTFRAQALVAVTEPTSPLALFLPKPAAETAVSKQVMRRAAESLIGTGIQAPEPELFERLALIAHIDGTQATGKASRLAAYLTRFTTAQPNAFPGSIEIAVADDDAGRAAGMAAAVAEGLVAEQEDAIARGRHTRDVEAATQIERLRQEAAAARQRLTALGGVEADPAQVRTNAAAQTAAAKARVDTIRAIIASGSPPLSDRRDVSSAIEALQSSYLDLSRQLAKARETLGDRHTTIISLQAEVKHAAANLTAEWRRLGKLAESELAAAREHESALSKVDGTADANKRAAIDDARRSVQAADNAVARALARQGDMPNEERAYRLLSRPVVPSVPAGLSSLARALVATLIGTIVFLLALFRPSMRPLSIWRRRVSVAPDMRSNHALTAPDTREAPQIAQDETYGSHSPAKPSTNQDLFETMSDLIPELEAISPAFGIVPTVIVAANETGLTTTQVALALGRAIAEGGGRALVIEAPRACPALAAAAAEEHDPILIDLFGALRVALRAKTRHGLLYLAPSLKQGARIASALARGTETPVFDDLAAEFDIVIVDGGEAATCAAEGWGGDVYVRVGRFASRRSDAQLADTFDVPLDMVVGTVVGTSFRPAAPKPLMWSSPSPMRHPPKRSLREAASQHGHAVARPPVPRRKMVSR